MTRPALRAVITDIEGTTSSISFVHDTLFPYARERLRAFLHARGAAPEVRAQVEAVAVEAGCAPLADAVADVLLAWMDEDRKATPLKALQGMIWAQGYTTGALHGHVYDDTPVFLRRWRAAGRTLHVYSSGSVEAQKLIFGHSVAGDLSPLFSGWFDTRVGAKREPASYRVIAEAIGGPPEAMLFLSDVGAELDAARAAGMQTCQLLRDDTAEPADAHPQAADFAAVDEQFRLSAYGTNGAGRVG